MTATWTGGNSEGILQNRTFHPYTERSPSGPTGNLKSETTFELKLKLLHLINEGQKRRTSRR